MRDKALDRVDLNSDLSQHGLQAGDIGAVVEMYEPDGLEVEFVAGGGETQALGTLREVDVRAIEANELISVRRLKRSA